MKSITAISAGFFSMIILEGFARIIIAFYHREEFIFSGLESLPNLGWIILILSVITFLGVFGTLLTTTIAGFEPLKHSLSLLVTVIILRGIPNFLQHQGSELYYNLLPILFSIVGIIIGYFLKLRLLQSEIDHDKSI